MNYISAQSTNGNWGNTFYTALATIIFQKTGYNNTLLNDSINWLLSNQNSDGGWSNLPGVPSSNPSSTAHAILALSVVKYTTTINLSISLDKSSYCPADEVKIAVNASVENVTLSGTVTDPNGYAKTLNFQGVNASYVVESAVLPGIYVINIIASSANGTGTATKSFVVKSIRDCYSCPDQYKVTLTLEPGLNLIAIPVNDSEVTDAKSLADKIGANSTEITRWDNLLHWYFSYVPTVPLNNFQIVKGAGICGFKDK